MHLYLSIYSYYLLSLHLFAACARPEHPEPGDHPSSRRQDRQLAATALQIRHPAEQNRAREKDAVRALPVQPLRLPDL